MRLSVYVMAAFGFGVPAVATAQVMCGDQIEESTELTDDILNCDQDPAVTVVGPAVLMMRGFTISCSSTADPEDEPPGIDAGVKLVERGAKLLGPGTVRHCHNGIVLGDAEDPGGGHTVIGVTVTENEDGIEIRSPDNHVGNNIVIKNVDEGIDIEGGRNVIIGNRVIRNLDKGVVVNSGDDHFRNQILDNTITHNGDDGIELEDTADETLILGNTSRKNAERGIDLESDANLVLSNKIINNTDEGIRVQVDLEDEIFSENNQIIENRVLGHDVDILDKNPNCDSNEYVENTFVSADPSFCIE
jgi:parallel beta-helix repeat protein